MGSRKGRWPSRRPELGHRLGRRGVELKGRNADKAPIRPVGWTTSVGHSSPTVIVSPPRMTTKGWLQSRVLWSLKKAPKRQGPFPIDRSAQLPVKRFLQTLCPLHQEHHPPWSRLWFPHLYSHRHPKLRCLQRHHRRPRRLPHPCRHQTCL